MSLDKITSSQISGLNLNPSKSASSANKDLDKSDAINFDRLIVYPRPDTPVVKKHDELLNQLMEKWDKEHPITEEELSHASDEYLDPNIGNRMRDRNEYERQFEENYRKDNPDYKLEIEDYEREEMKYASYE